MSQASKVLLNNYTAVGKKKKRLKTPVFPLKEIFLEVLSSVSQASEDMRKACGAVKGKILKDKMGNGW